MEYHLATTAKLLEKNMNETQKLSERRLKQKYIVSDCINLAYFLRMYICCVLYVLMNL